MMIKTVQFTVKGQIDLDLDSYSKELLWTDEEMIRFEFTRFGSVCCLSDVFVADAPNLRSPDSCCLCEHNLKGYVSVDCTRHPVRLAQYSTERVCDDFKKKNYLQGERNDSK